MRSVPLDNIKKYCFNLTYSQFNAYKCGEDEIRRMWSDQGMEFWVKFAVTLRKYIINASSKYDEKCEKEFIIFLKALTHKNFRELESYFRIAGKTIEEKKQICEDIAAEHTDPKSISGEELSEVERYSQLKALTMKLKCAGTFLRVFEFWCEAEIGNDFKFTPPESWFIPVQYSEPFESFIRAKWGGYRNIEDILGCKREDIAWWNAPARKIDQSKPQAPTSTTKKVVSQESTEKITNKKSINKLKEKKANWLPNIEHVKIFKSPPRGETDFKQFFSAFTLPTLKPLLEYSILPLIKRKYHIINATALVEDSQDTNYLGVCPWFVLSLDVFGNSYMHFIHDSNEAIKNIIESELSSTDKGEKISEWIQNRKSDTQVLENLRDKLGAPDEASDCINTATEFLLEPCILIQLPWQPVLFRQWLAAALIQVLKFELESTEFRHWPLTEELEPVIRGLLALAAELKERILLGWTIMSYDTSLYPKKDPKHHEIILNEVILPSVHSLELFSSEKPFKVIKGLKKLLWSKSKQDIDTKVNVSRTAFLINGNLSGFFSLFYGHTLYFNPYNNCTEPFPTSNHRDTAGLYQQLNEIKNDRKILPPEEGYELNVQSIEEKRMNILTQFSSFNEPLQYGTNNISKAIDIVKNVIIKCKHFSLENCNKLLEIVNSNTAKTIASFIVGHNANKMSALEQFLASCIFYYDMSQCVEKLKHDTSVLGCMNRLTAMVMEREQLVRVIASCAYLLDECPTYCGYQAGKCAVECVVDKEKPMELAEMKAVLSDFNKKKPLTKDGLWSKFNEDWKKAVEYNTPLPKLEDGIPAIVSSFENRIGRIVWNASQKAFTKVKKGGEAFPEAHIVQYMLPCHVAALVDAAKYPESEKNKARVVNLINFLHSIVQYYEKLYQAWLDSTEKQKRLVIENEASEDLRLRCVLSNYLIERTSFALHGYTGLGRMGECLDTMPHFAQVAHSMQEYPMFNPTGYNSPIEFCISTTWVNYAYPHIKAMHEVMFNMVPNTDAILYCQELQDFYFASALIQQLDTYYSLTPWASLPFLGKETPEHILYQELIKPLRLWRYELFSIVFETESKLDYPQNMLQMFINGKGKDILSKMFHIMKCARSLVEGSERVNVHIPSWGVELNKAFDDFLAGKLTTLPLFEEKSSDIPDQVVVPKGTLAKCRNCQKQETALGDFVQCPVCIDNKYPYPDFYCSTRCQDIWWKTEHMVEHLEFNLGLCDFATINISD